MSLVRSGLPRITKRAARDVKGSNGLWLKQFNKKENNCYVQYNTPAKLRWIALNRRILKEKTYQGVVNGFTDFQEFAEWCQIQEGYYSLDDKGKVYELDKDILFPGCRIYSPDTCLFVPRKVNAFFYDIHAVKGVYWREEMNKYYFAAEYDGNNKNGLFLTEGEARIAYLLARNNFISLMIEEFQTFPKLLEGFERHIKFNLETIKRISIAGKVYRF